ncbi:MAG: hypothetical protein WCH46_05965 [bacterium]
MPSRPIQSDGILHHIDSQWHIVLAESPPSFEENMPVSVVLWDQREAGSRSEVEEIARVQQLEPSIVALGLSAEGTLGATKFGVNLKSSQS